MTRFSIIAAVMFFVISAPSPASAYHCGMLMNKLRQTAKAADSAEQLLADVRAKVKSGEFGKGELKGAKQNNKTQQARYEAAREEERSHCS